MAGFDLTRAAGILKRVYDKKLHEVLYSVDNAKLNPGFVGLKRDSGKRVVTPFGSAYAVPIKYGRVSASSADYATAETLSGQADQGAAPKYAQFLVTPSTYFTVHQVAGDTLDRATDEGAFIDAAAEVVKDALAAHMRRLMIHTHGTGSGKVATITAAPTSTTITIDPSEVRRFEIGDWIVAAAAEATGSLRSATAAQVTGRNSVTGVLTLSIDVTALSWASGDSVFFKGDRAAAGFTNVFAGYFGIVGSSAPSGGESFFGVDRSVDTRLGGLRYDATGKDMGEMLTEAAMLAVGEGAMIARCRMSTKDYGSLVKERDDLKHIAINSENSTLGFKAIEYVSPVGTFPVLLDEGMPIGHAFLETEDWRMLCKDGELATIVSHDGLVLRKVAGADAYSCYVKSMIQPVCDRPGHQVHVYNVGS